MSEFVIFELVLIHFVGPFIWACLHIIAAAVLFLWFCAYLLMQIAAGLSKGGNTDAVSPIENLILEVTAANSPVLIEKQRLGEYKFVRGGGIRGERCKHQGPLQASEIESGPGIILDRKGLLNPSLYLNAARLSRED